MTIRLALSWMAVVAATPALADIPTIDAPTLTEHSKTSAAKVTLVPITTQRQTSNKGVGCAVTTGQKGNFADPTVQPQAGTGAAKIQAYAPDFKAVPDTHGATLGRQTLFTSSGNVVAGVDAGGQTIAAALTGFRAAGQLIGTSQTVMAAFDANSAARVQNNFTWNSVGIAANLWVTALNALNLAASGDQSRLAAALRFTSSGMSPWLTFKAGQTGTAQSSTSTSR